MSLAIWDHTVLPATRHKWTHPALTPAMQADTWFTYPRGMEGWVDLVDSAPAGSWTSDLSITSPTPNHCTTKTMYISVSTGKPFILYVMMVHDMVFWLPIGGPAAQVGLFQRSPATWRCAVFIAWTLAMAWHDDRAVNIVNCIIYLFIIIIIIIIIIISWGMMVHGTVAGYSVTV